MRRHGLLDDLMNYQTVHEGFTGVLDGKLTETDYKAADKGKGQGYEQLSAGVASTGGWVMPEVGGVRPVAQTSGPGK